MLPSRSVRFAIGSTLFAAACAGDAKRAPDASPRDSTHVALAPAPARTTPFGNLGAYHRTIKTGNASAQTFFDEGLTLLYGFNHEEAFRSFTRAAELDPLSPMPHWGMALALGTNINDPAPADRLQKAYVHLVAAQQRAANGSEVEQGLVAALGHRYGADSSGRQDTREAAYAKAMGALAARYPADPDVATLYAESMMNLHPWRLYKADGTPEAWTGPIVAALEGVIAAHPQHPGANHYYIHAVEASNAPARAMASAGRLETLVPGAGHLVHMPSHIYIRTGQFTKSAKSNTDASAVDEAYFKTAGQPSFYTMGYYFHNLQFEAASAMYAGNLGQARRAARRTAEAADPVADQMAMVEPFAAMELFALVRFGQWGDILNAPAPTPKPTRTLQTGFRHWARGAALAGSNRASEAQTELALLTTVHERVPKDAMVGPVNWGGDVLAVAIADLTGRVAEANGNLPAAIAAFTSAVTLEDKLGYNEPPDWLLPERERLGVALLAAGKAADAERVFRADLRKHVGNPRSLFGLWRALEAQRSPAAAQARKEFDAAWTGADVQLKDDLHPKR